MATETNMEKSSTPSGANTTRVKEPVVKTVISNIIRLDFPWKIKNGDDANFHYYGPWNILVKNIGWMYPHNKIKKYLKPLVPNDSYFQISYVEMVSKRTGKTNKIYTELLDSGVRIGNGMFNDTLSIGKIIEIKEGLENARRNSTNKNVEQRNIQSGGIQEAVSEPGTEGTNR